MPNYDGLTPGEILADANVSEFIGEMGLAIADAQMKLDTNSINQLGVLADTTTPLGQQNLLQLGFTPAFYHYQYADLSVSMQIRLQVGNSFGLGVKVGGGYSNTDSFDSAVNNSNSQSSNLQVGGTVKVAKLALKSAGTGALDVNGKAFTPTGDNAKDRAKSFVQSLMSDPSSKVEIALYKPPVETFTIDIPDATAKTKVNIGSNTIAITARGTELGLIQVAANSDTDYILNTTTTKNTTSKADLAAYAAHVKDEIGTSATLFDLTVPLYSFYFDTGDSDLIKRSGGGPNDNDGFAEDLSNLARLLKGGSTQLEVKGFADKQKYTGRTDQQSLDLNKALGQARADSVKKLLVDLGMDAANILTSSDGNATANADAASVPDNILYRKVEIKVQNGANYWILVEGNLAENSLDPDLITNQNASANGFIAFSKGDTIGLNGEDVIIDGKTLQFESGTAEQIATKLSAKINDPANPLAPLGFTSSVQGSVVTLYKDTGEFEITLGSDGSADIKLTGSGNVTVSQNFSSAQSSSNVTNKEGKKAFAIGASVDVRFSRQFDLAVTGNSAIRARLVAVPAPPQFLDTIQDYINDLEFDPQLNPQNPPGPLTPGTPGGNITGGAGGTTGGTQ